MTPGHDATVRQDGVTATRPLCVDLDGTLVRTDLLVESALALLRRNPLFLFVFAFWLLGGRARLKHEIAARATLDPAVLPYREELLEWLRIERAAGRSLILATAADVQLARSVATQLGLFDEVLASDGTRNLKGDRKREALVARFGERGFDYAGDAAADLAIWRSAAEAIVVAAPEAVRREAESLGRVTRTIAREPLRFRTILKALRIHQWLKNLLLFVPVLTAHRYLDVPTVLRTALAFAAFSLCASSVYLVNDLIDLDADRRHRTKRTRPFAAGTLPLAFGLLGAPVLVVGAFALAWLVGPEFAALLALYYATTNAYTFLLKKEVLLDVICLAGLYTLRIFAGASAGEVPLTPWLLAFSMFLFLSLALVKRVSELNAQKDDAATRIPGRGYARQDAVLLTQMGVSAGYLSVVVFALYVHLGGIDALYRHPHVLWLACPLLFYWVSRAWLLTSRGLMHDDPVIFAVRDRASYLVGAIGLVIVWFAR